MRMMGEGLGRARRLAEAAARLVADRRGVAAVEFALMAPLLLALYFVTMEVSQGIDVNKKVGRVSSMVGDLVTQQQQISRRELDSILDIGQSILQPYNRSSPTITVTAIQISNEPEPKAVVVWSRKRENDTGSVALAAGTPVSVPPTLNIAGTFLIKVEAQLAYAPVITWAAGQKKALGLSAMFDGIRMNEVYHLRPRMSLSIPCTNC